MYEPLNKKNKTVKKTSNYGRSPKLNPKMHCVMVCSDDIEWGKFFTMYEEPQLHAKAVLLKAHLLGQKLKVPKIDKAMLEYYTKLSDYHAQFHPIGMNYNQTVKELRCYLSEKKVMVLFYKLEKCTIDFVRLSREIVELSREMHAKWKQRKE